MKSKTKSVIFTMLALLPFLMGMFFSAWMMFGFEFPMLLAFCGTSMLPLGLDMLRQRKNFLLCGSLFVTVVCALSFFASYMWRTHGYEEKTPGYLGIFSVALIIVFFDGFVWNRIYRKRQKELKESSRKHQNWPFLVALFGSAVFFPLGTCLILKATDTSFATNFIYAFASVLYYAACYRVRLFIKHPVWVSLAFYCTMLLWAVLPYFLPNFISVPFNISFFFIVFSWSTRGALAYDLTCLAAKYIKRAVRKRKMIATEAVEE